MNDGVEELVSLFFLLLTGAALFAGMSIGSWEEETFIGDYEKCKEDFPDKRFEYETVDNFVDACFKAKKQQEWYKEEGK